MDPVFATQITGSVLIRLLSSDRVAELLPPDWIHRSVIGLKNKPVTKTS